MIGELAAIGASLCWTVGPLLAIEPVKKLGSLHFARLRLPIAFLFMALLSVPDLDQEMAGEHVFLLLLSGLLGYLIGDWLLFAGYRHIGPRRGGLIFVLNAPVTLLLGVLIFSESLEWPEILGTSLIFSGIVLALAFRNRREGYYETIDGSLPRGVVLCILAACAQAAGTLLAKPVMEAGVSPFMANTVRLAIAAVTIVAVTVFQGRLTDYMIPRPLAAKVVFHAMLGPSLGAAAMMLALTHTTAGLAAILSALSPIFILPILQFGFKQPLNMWCWLGAMVACGGLAVIFL